MFQIDNIAFWIIVTSALVNLCGAMLGSFLVLRRLSLLGDAISHAILPGLAMAFILTSSRAPIPMLIGALIAGLLTVLFTQLIHRYNQISEDSAMGVVFTSLFALGVIMVTKVADNIHLDPGSVLYGILESAALDNVLLFGLEIPRITLTMLIATIIVFLFIIISWKELKITSFDPVLATTLGINAQYIHYALMGMVAGVTVAAFEAVGSILIIAMLIAPPATAYLLTDRLSVMIIIASIIGIIAAIIGRFAAVYYDTSVAGMTATISGLLFLITVLFAPRYGYFSRKFHRFHLSFRIIREDILGILYRWQESNPQQGLPKEQILSIMNNGIFSVIGIIFLKNRGDIQFIGQGYRLTNKGEKKAVHLIQLHRLWESYLDRHFILPSDHLHLPADRIEHYLDENIREKVKKELDSLQTDPHGRSIPE